MSLAISIGKPFLPTVLTGSAATIYTNPSSNPLGTVMVGMTIRVTNTSAGIRQVTLYAVNASGAAGAGNCFANAESIAVGAHADYAVPILGVGDFLQGLADTASDCTVFALAGTLITP